VASCEAGLFTRSSIFSQLQIKFFSKRQEIFSQPKVGASKRDAKLAISFGFKNQDLKIFFASFAGFARDAF
jgi:hypothetical protein